MTTPNDNVNIEEIMRIIPHRYPFLLVDKVIDIVKAESAVGIKNVTMNEPHFTGHFPNQPVMPGVLIIEAMAQTAAILVGKTLDLVDKNMSVYFMAIDGVKFRRMVVPGDQLHLRVTVTRPGGKVWKFHGEAFVGSEKACEADFTAMMQPPQE